VFTSFLYSIENQPSRTDARYKGSGQIIQGLPKLGKQQLLYNGMAFLSKPAFPRRGRRGCELGAPHKRTIARPLLLWYNQPQRASWVQESQLDVAATMRTITELSAERREQLIGELAAKMGNWGLITPAILWPSSRCSSAGHGS